MSHSCTGLELVEYQLFQNKTLQQINFLEKYIQQLEEKLEEEMLRPPLLGGSLYENSKDHFNRNKK